MFNFMIAIKWDICGQLRIWKGLKSTFEYVSDVSKETAMKVFWQLIETNKRNVGKGNQAVRDIHSNHGKI